MSSLDAEIVALEDSTWKALQTTGSALIPFISPDCIMQFPMGLKLTADSTSSVPDILHSPAFVPWKSYQLDKVDVTPVGSGGAVISYLARATRPGKERDVETSMLCSSVWRKEGDGKWKLCFHQQSLTERWPGTDRPCGACRI